MLHQVITLTLVATMTATSPAIPQGIPKGASISGVVRTAPTTPVFVGNPFINYTSLADSAASVAIGAGMRDRLDGKIGSDLSIVTRQVMNQNLAQSGFPANAILSLGSATALGKQSSARIFVTSTLAKSAGGLYTVVVRVWGQNEEAGQVVRATQTAGQALPDFGSKIAEILIPIIRDAHGQAKNCSDLASTKPDKAAEAANKALKSVPTYGYAEYCLATLALKKDSVGAEALTHFKNAAAGDPMSLSAWSQLAIIHQKQHDTTGAVTDYQSMLTQDPTNAELAKSASDLFRKYGRRDALNQLVEEQLKLDPNNTDMYDLKANGCLEDNDYGCALAALAQIWSVDSARGDKEYFNKIIFIAKTKPDTQAYLKWTTLGAKKFNDNTDIVSELARAFTWVGMTDSAIAVTNRLIALDPPGQLNNVLQVSKDLADANQTEKILPFTNYFRKFGDDDAKFKFAGIGVTGMQAMYQAFAKDSTTQPTSYGRIGTIGDSMLSVGTTRPEVVLPVNLFIGLAAYQQIFPLQSQLQAGKTCDLARQYDAMLTKAEGGLAVAAAGGNAQYTSIAQPLLDNIGKAKPYAASQIKALCGQ